MCCFAQWGLKLRCCSLFCARAGSRRSAAAARLSLLLVPPLQQQLHFDSARGSMQTGGMAQERPSPQWDPELASQDAQATTEHVEAHSMLAVQLPVGESHCVCMLFIKVASPRVHLGMSLCLVVTALDLDSNSLELLSPNSDAINPCADETQHESFSDNARYDTAELQ